MHIDELEIDSRIKKFLSNTWNIEKLFPPQSESLPLSLVGKNVLLSIPTASGKSLVAYLTLVHRIGSKINSRKGIYIVPLKALATEKFKELKELASCMGLKVGIAIGDRNESADIVDVDILVCTSEKLDSMIRLKPEIVEEIGVIVADEFHLLHDPTRGPTLEIILSKIFHQEKEVQILALSATVGNSKELASWLDAKLIQSKWRPVTLYSGTLTGLRVTFHTSEDKFELEERKLPESTKLIGGVQKNIQAVLQYNLKRDRKLMIFVSSRSSAQKEARELSKYVRNNLESDNYNIKSELVENWEKMANLVSDSEDDSAMSKMLSESIRGGIAFHHAGLTSKQREIVENGFRDGNLLCVVATPTLAQGVNLPASMVLIRDSKRWSTIASRMIPISIMEIRQMMGRAGRPKFSEFGEAVILSKNKDDEKKIVERYLLGEPENVFSKLANVNSINVEEDGALLSHLLSLISSGGIEDRYSISRFFSKTFLSTQMDSEDLENRVDGVINWLVENGMINRDGESSEVAKKINASRVLENLDDKWNDEAPDWKNSESEIIDIQYSKLNKTNLSPRKGPAIFGFSKASDFERKEELVPESQTMRYSSTTLGSRVSRLYLNPISGKILYDGLRRAIDIISGKDEIGQVSPISILHLAACTPDFLSIWPKKKDYDIILSELHIHERELLSQAVDLDEESRMKAVLVVESWIEEKKMADIEEDWGVQPGDLRSRVELMEWLLFSMMRILYEDEKMRDRNGNSHKILYELINELHQRVRFGCKSDILSLVRVKGIGRVRARELERTLGIINADDIVELTERDRQKLADLRGWSTKLVEKLIKSAKKTSKRRN
ncbi:MAG: hypothetical protein CL993_04320 [Euryarchaeota archaeon]|nr:hypothetical protein [Euryarchaeota archaeon]